MDPDPEPYLKLISVILTPFFTGFTVNAVIGLIILCFLLVASALISSSETAFFSLQPADIDDLESRNDSKSQLVLKLREQPKLLLATILIGNNFVNVTITLLATYIVSEMFDMVNHPAAAFIMEVLIITSLVLIIGEITPKILAARKPVKFSRFMARSLQVLMTLFKPLSRLLVNSTSFMDKHLEKKKAEISMDDIATAVDIATESSTPLEEKNMLKGIATFTEKEVSSVMKPRIDIIAVEISMSFREMLDTVIKSGFSRIPVYEGSFDNIIGVLHIKTYLSAYLRNPNVSIRKKLQKPYFVSSRIMIDDLFNGFKNHHTHIALVRDKNKHIIGMVTMDDVLEELVSDISEPSHVKGHR